MIMCGRIVINGRVWEGGGTCKWVDEVLFLPLQAAAERLGASCRWIAYPQHLEVEKDGKTLILEVGAEAAQLQGEEILLDHPVFVEKGMVMVPVTLLCRFFGLFWTYVEDVDAAVLSRTEPALAGKRVVIDPGHGGDDPGIISGDLVESAFTWDVARRLGDLLMLSGVLAAFTRQQEETASLAQRVKVVEEARPDLLVSIHFNSFLCPEHNGLETYWYSSWPARQLAEHVHKGILDEIEIPNRGVRESAFHVLRHSPAVSVLVKLGFATGAGDQQILKDSWLRERAALGIFRGIRDFIEARPGRM
jgi:N-acetylmuramoyl-L-alanine amidase